MTTRTLSLQLEEDFTTHTAAPMRKVFSGSSPSAFVRDSRYRSLQTALTKPKL